MRRAIRSTEVTSQEEVGKSTEIGGLKIKKLSP
jgi:hypothetical protein